MYSPSGFYRKTSRLKIRPVPEMGFCLVFTPTKPRLFTLNPTAWLVLELCDGRSGRAVEKDYADTLDLERPDAAVRAEVRGILEDLESKDIVERCGKPLIQRGTPRTEMKK